MLLATEPYWLNLLDLSNENECIKRILETLKNIIKKFPSYNSSLFLIPNFGDKHPTHKSVTELILKMIRGNEKSLGLRFSVLANDHRDLKAGDVPEGLCKRFKGNKNPLSDKARLSEIQKNKEWQITDGDTEFTIEKENDELNIYRPRNVEMWLYESPWASLDTSDVNVVIPLNKHAMFAKCQAISVHQSQILRTKYTDVALSHNKYNAEVLREMLFRGYGKEERNKPKWDYLEAFSAREWKLENYSFSGTSESEKNGSSK